MNRICHTAILLTLALAACSRGSEPAPGASETLSPDLPDAAMASATAEPVVPTTAAPAKLSLELPAAMHGRFGMVPADCTTRMGDDKGLVTISAKGLKFYESFARLAKVQENTPLRVKGTFAYEGEGMEWQRPATLDLKDGGKTLVLEEFGADAVEGPRSFRRCQP